MSQFVPANLGEGQLPLAKTTLYTVPEDKTAIIKSIILVNTHATDSITVNLYVNFGNGSRRITPKDVNLAAGEKYEDHLSVTLEADDVIEGQASIADTVDYIINGAIEIEL